MFYPATGPDVVCPETVGASVPNTNTIVSLHHKNHKRPKSLGKRVFIMGNVWGYDGERIRMLHPKTSVSDRVQSVELRHF